MSLSSVDNDSNLYIYKSINMLSLKERYVRNLFFFHIIFGAAQLES
jgi:hypothetical protein